MHYSSSIVIVLSVFVLFVGLILASTLRLAIAELPSSIAVCLDQALGEEPLFEVLIVLPVFDVDRCSTSFAILFQVAAHMFHALLPSASLIKLAIAKQARRLWRRRPELLVAPCLMLREIVFGDWVIALVVAGDGMSGSGVHPPQMLREEVLTVEVIEVDGGAVGAVYCCRAQVAAPVSEADVLRTDVSLPFVLRREG